jgi:hypothetical protein
MMLRALVIGLLTSALLTMTAWTQGQLGTATETRACSKKP